jgi:hypothetical protein
MACIKQARDHFGYNRRWEDNIKTDLIKRGSVDVMWLLLAQDGTQWRAFLNTVMNVLVT